MCGLSGIVDFQQPPSLELLERMRQALTHRGPDDSGVWQQGPAGLCHNRLSIIDLSANGHQPMITADGALAMVYNGEVYNFQALRQELEQAGCAFRSHSDSEVVLQAYRHWGESAFARLEGMYALALWDSRRQCLLLVRDRFGIKPLYLYRQGSRLTFGSEVKALLAAGIPRQLNPIALHEFLYYGTALGGKSCFEGVTKLEPGHLARFDRNGLELSQYVSIYDVQPVQDTLDQATERVRELLSAAVTRHLISDVPVGVFLSGGVDSSAITALASRTLGGRLQTFSVGFDFAGKMNELEQAAAVASHFGTEHHELMVSCKELPELLERLVHCHDEPFGDEANLPLYLLCQQLGGKIKVVLQGDGGDELFGGYFRYSRLNHRRLFRLLGIPASLVAPFLPGTSKAYRALRTLTALRDPDESRQMAWLMAQEHPDHPPYDLFSNAFAATLRQSDPFARYGAFHARFAALDPVQRMLYTDSGIILPDTYFEKVDKSTMAWGIEVRVPFVDTQLAAYVMGLPAHMKVRGWQKKFLLRRALRGIVPDFVLDSPKKGFGVPMSRWLRGPLAPFLRELLGQDAIRQWGALNLEAIGKRLDEHVSGRFDHGMILKKIMLLCLWYKAYLTPQAGRSNS